MLDESLPPDSDRTVYKRVPADLLQRARQAALSDQPPQSFDDSDRTAVFAPPRELLTLSQNLPAATATASEPPRDRATPVTDAAVFSRETARPRQSDDAPQIVVEPAAAPLLPVAHRSDPAPRLAVPPVRADEVASFAPAPSKGRRVLGLVALVLLLLLAASFLYMHSGRSLLMPSSPTKNG